MILHILSAPNFFHFAVNDFDKHFRGQNIFLLKNKTDIKETHSNIHIEYIPRLFQSRHRVLELENLIEKYKVTDVLIHYLTSNVAAVINNIKNKFGLKTYWIFYGGDLYDFLNNKGLYELYDSNLSVKKSLTSRKYLGRVLNETSFLLKHGTKKDKAFKRFIEELDFFCFWNEYDFELLKRHFDTTCVHKDFLYFSVIEHKLHFLHIKSDKKVMVNHSASHSGNHFTVLNKLKQLDKNKDFEVVCPLSYGDVEFIQEVNELGVNHFGQRFQAITQFLSLNEYYEILNGFSIAIFGNRRQQGAGNVFYLLGTGCKVFLRNDNNMLQWLQKHGFWVFSFEDDLKHINDLTELSLDQMQHNQLIYREVFSEKRENDIFSNLIENYHK